MTRSPGGTTQSQIIQDDIFNFPLMNIVAGKVAGAEAVRVFGVDPDVGTSFAAVWPASIAHVFRTTHAIMTVSSSSTDDDAAGIGALTVFIRGCDQDFNRLSETVIMDGQNAVNTDNEYMIIDSLTVMTTGSNDQNVGIIYVGTGTVTLGVPAVIESIAPAGDGISLNSWITAPVGFTLYMLSIVLFSSRSSNTNIDIRGRVKPNGLSWRTIASAPLFQAILSLNNMVPIKIPEKSIFLFEAKGDAAGVPVATRAEFVLIEDAVFKWPD